MLIILFKMLIISAYFILFCNLIFIGNGFYSDLNDLNWKWFWNIFIHIFPKIWESKKNLNYSWLFRKVFIKYVVKRLHSVHRSKSSFILLRFVYSMVINDNTFLSFVSYMRSWLLFFYIQLKILIKTENYRRLHLNLVWNSHEQLRIISWVDFA